MVFDRTASAQHDTDPARSFSFKHLPVLFRKGIDQGALLNSLIDAAAPGIKDSRIMINHDTQAGHQYKGF